MASSKSKMKRYKTELMEKMVIYCLLFVFPLGQLIALKLKYAGVRVVVHPIDAIALFTLGLYAVGLIKEIPAFKHLKDYILVSLFSLVFSLNVFSPEQVLVGSMYLIRFASYTTLFLAVYEFVKNLKARQKYLFEGLIGVVVVTAVLGWMQYIFIPDLRDLAYLGWDNHLFRLVGAFLDPGFTGIILTLGAILSGMLYLKKRQKLYLVISFFLILTVAFTYSRASYLALIAGFSYLIIRKFKIKMVFFSILIFGLLILLLPRPSSEGVKLERVYSATQRLGNYSQTLQIFEKSPVFGVGFNNICFAREKYIKGNKLFSNACASADSSLLFVLATTGVVGFLILTYAFYKIYKKLGDGFYAQSLKAVALAVFVHSFFANSIFYPWVMAYMATLLALGVAEN
jgi:O-antigen ligase